MQALQEIALNSLAISTNAAAPKWHTNCVACGGVCVCVCEFNTDAKRMKPLEPDFKEIYLIIIKFSCRKKDFTSALLTHTRRGQVQPSFLITPLEWIRFGRAKTWKIASMIWYVWQILCRHGGQRTPHSHTVAMEPGTKWKISSVAWSMRFTQGREYNTSAWNRFSM